MLAPLVEKKTRRPLGPRLTRMASWTLVLGLIALNAWWWWDDRPTPALSQLSRLVGGPRNAEAEQELRRIVRKSPNDGEALTLLARALASRGDTLGCAEHLHRVPFWSPLKAEALYGEGLAWLERNQARRAELAFRQYLTSDPNHPETVERPRQAEVEERLFNHYALENRWEEARELCHRARALAPPQGKPLWLLHGMRTHLERLHPSKSIDSLRDYAKADPDDLEARRALALAADVLELHDEADRNMAIVLAARPKDPRLWRDCLEMLFARKDMAAVEEALAKAPPEADTEGTVWLIRGQVLEQAGKFAQAAEAYRHAVALLPFNPKAHYRLSLAARRLGHREEAEIQSRRHVELDRWTGELKKNLDLYGAALQEQNSRAIEAAIEQLVMVCRGLGLDEDADGWAEELAYRRRNPS